VSTKPKLTKLRSSTKQMLLKYPRPLPSKDPTTLQKEDSLLQNKDPRPTKRRSHYYKSNYIFDIG
jgi:hypothetical protein